MDSQYYTAALFPTPVYYTSIELDTELKDLIQEDWERMDNDLASITVNRYLLESDSYTKIKKQIDFNCNRFIEDVMGYTSCEPYITNSWGVKIQSGERALPHYHANSIFSGVLYLNAGSGAGEISFLKDTLYPSLFPTMIEPLIKETTMFNTGHYDFTPQNGMLILFPSWLEHAVLENKSGETRYSLAFNTFVRGEFGGKESKLCL